MALSLERAAMRIAENYQRNLIYHFDHEARDFSNNKRTLFNESLVH